MAYDNFNETETAQCVEFLCANTMPNMLNAIQYENLHGVVYGDLKAFSCDFGASLPMWPRSLRAVATALRVTDEYQAFVMAAVAHFGAEAEYELGIGDDALALLAA